MSLSKLESIVYGSLHSKNRVVFMNMLTKDISRKAFHIEDSKKVRCV